MSWYEIIKGIFFYVALYIIPMVSLLIHKFYGYWWILLFGLWVYILGKFKQSNLKEEK